MSNVKLQASASGTGTVTIAPPVTNSDLTINLPANSGTVPTIASVVNNGVVYTNSTGAITSSSALTFDGTNLGVGTSSPAYAIHAAGNVNGNVTVASNNTSAGTSAFSRFLALADAGNAQFGMTSSAYTDITGATDALLLNANNASGGMAFALDGVLRMKLDSSGNLGLGVTPSAWATSGTILKALQIGAAGSFAAGASDPSVHVSQNAYFDGTNWRYIQSAAAGNYYVSGNTHNWRIAGSGTAGNTITFTQAMTLDASGRLGIGTTSPATAYRMSLTGDGSTMVGGLALTSGGNAAYIGQIGATSADCEYWNAANGYVRFGTNNTERARITSGGDLLVGTTSGSYHTFAKNNGGDWATNIRNTASSSPYGLYVSFSAASPNNTTSEFINCSDSSLNRFVVRSNGGIANYSANDVNLSDRREKTNFAPAKDYLDTICAIPVQTFNYIDQSEDDPGTTLGVVAQDVQAVAPELVMESNWGSKDEPKMRLSIYQTDLQYALMKALQELNAKVESLTTELNALKGT